MTNVSPAWIMRSIGSTPLPARPPIRWPGGARLACCVFLYLEHWELLPPEDAVRDPRFGDPFGDFVPDYRTYTWRDYGNRVGIFRILDRARPQYGLPVTVAANAGACQRYPFLVEQFMQRGLRIRRARDARDAHADEQAH